MSKKVIVIGSGLGGLTCAYILLRNGYDVTVLEQGAQPGGCLQCFSRRGVKFETGMHFIGSAAPGQTMDMMMRYLDISDKVKLSQLDTAAYNTVALCGQQFRFANGSDAFLNQMADYFPKEKDALRRYINIIQQICSASTLRSLTSGNRDIAANTDYQRQSINDVLDSIFSDDLLKKVLVGDLPLYSAELDKTPFSQHAYIWDFYNRSAFRIVNGSDSISFSLVGNIIKMGGQVAMRKKAVKILCDATKAIGVTTEDEQFYPADFIISAIHPNRLLKMLDTRLIRPAFRTRIYNIPQTASGFAVYLVFKSGTMPYMNTNYFGYSQDSPWNCEHYSISEWPKGFLYMHFCHEYDAVWAKSGVILSYMNFSDVEKWKGTSPGHRGTDYEAFKKEHAGRLISEVEKHFPGFTASIESYYTSTPLTYLDYTGTENGSMYGASKDCRAGAENRIPYRTKIPNLYLTGQNINSHGMLGVTVGTLVTCSELVPPEQIYRQIKEANR